MKTELTTTPSFIFQQGELISEDGAEFPVQVTYFTDDRVEIKSLNGSTHGAILRLQDIKGLMREILKHAPEANETLNPKKK